MFRAPAHVIISWVFFILIGIVFIYSYFFYPNSHPIDCFIKSQTGKECASCGFSRAFSYYTHLKFAEGKNFNALSWFVFLYFLLQFNIRFFVILYYRFSKKVVKSSLIIADIIISICGFLLAFLPLLF